MRICWIHPTTRTPSLEPLWEKLENTTRSAMRPDAELEFRFLSASGNFTRSSYAEHLNSVLMVEAALTAQADGFDGIFLGCWNDALWEAREILSVPVASVGEQSMLAALTLGKRFAVVTVSEKTGAAIENDLFAYGLGARAIAHPVRSIVPESDGDLLLGAVSDPARRFIPRLEEIGLQCVADGAEVVLVGCGYYGPLLRASGYSRLAGTAVPVVDSSTVALKYLEAMVDIAGITGIVKSEHLQFRPPPPDAMMRARAALGLV